MMDSLLSTTNVMYVTMPGLDDDEWTEKELAEYRRETGDRSDEPWRYIARLEIKGTTFSGLSTRTTLGNTLRSIAFIFFYCVVAGVKKPWESKEVAAIASGDDVVLWCKPYLAQKLHDTILACTARNAEPQIVGLGQVVKTVKKGLFWETEFCSKISLSLDGTLGSWMMFRDLSKVLKTKQHTTSRNLTFLYRPEVYLAALLFSLKLEQASSLIEAVREQQLIRLTGGQYFDDEKLRQAAQPNMHSFRYISPLNYTMEPEINASLNITTWTYLKAIDTNTIYAGPTHLTQERQVCYEKAVQMSWRHCKTSKPDAEFRPPRLQPQIGETMCDNQLVTVTNTTQHALDFFSGYQPKLHVVVDNEADRGYANCMTIFIP